MRKIWKFVVAGAVALGLSACGLPGLELGPTKKLTPSGAQFSMDLFNEYLGLSQLEYDEGHYGASDYFALKARAAARGESVLPTEMSERTLSAEHVPVLTKQRARLVGLLDSSARVRLPALAARAQAMFDCWMEEQEENRQPNDIAACRDGFMTAMKELEAAMAPPKKVEAPAPAPAPQPAPPAPQVQKSFLVFFDWDSAEVSAQASDVLSEAVKSAMQAGSASIQLIGHADTSGPSAYNQKLSLKRAEAVQAALKRLGLDKPAFEVTAKGETEPLVPTGDGIREPQNRRVQVLLP